MDWTLSPDQKQRWQARWSGLRHGIQADLASELAPIKVLSRGKITTKSADTWKVDLSNFFQGEPRALGKVLGDDPVAAVVARHLELADADALRAEHEKVRGIVRDGPLDVRIPGFEDLGPVRARDLYWPPAAGGPHGLRVNDTEIEIFPPKLDSVLLACADGPEARSIAIEGASGLGKSTFLKAVRDVLAEAGKRVGLRPAPDIDVLAVDDWDLQPQQLREATRAWMGPGRVAITARTKEPREPELADSFAVLKLTDLQPHWVMDYLRHVAPLLERRWGVGLDLSRIEEWLDDDPFAYRLISHHRVLGLTLRLAARGTYPPFAPGTEAQLLRDHLATTTTNDLAATYLRVAGESLLGELAGELLRGASLSMPLVRCATLALTTAAQFGARVVLDDCGSIGLVSALSGTTPYRRSEQQLICEAPALALPAVRSRWREHLPRLVVHPDGAEALIAAACSAPDEVLRALLELEPALLCQAMPTLTRVVAAPARYTDAEAWLRAFRMCATWWAHGPKNPAAPGPGVARPATERFGGLSPLTVLALASVEHRRLFPAALSPLDLAADLPSPLRTWLAVYDTAVPSAEQLRAALAYVAPMKAPSFPAIGEIRTGQDWTSSTVHGLQPMDWGLWWRRVAVPHWREHPDGERHIAGTADGASAIPGCHQNSDRSLALWRTAIEGRIAAGDEGAPAAIAEAILFGLTRGGSRLQRLLHDASDRWLRLRRRVQPLLAEKILLLKPYGFWDSEHVWTPRGSLFTRVLVDFLEQASMEQLWRFWVETNTEELPWRSFLMAGISAVEVARWGLAKGADGPGVQRATGILVFEEEVVKQTRRLEALEALLASGDVEAMVCIFAGPIPWKMRRRLYSRVRSLGPREAIGARIEAALDCGARGEAWVMLLDNLLPGPDDEEAWTQVVERCDHIGERIARVAQWCAGQSGPDRWNMLMSWLEQVEQIWRDSERNEPARRNLEGLQTHGGSWLAKQLARDDLPGPEDRHDVLRKVLSSPLWAPAMADWSQRGVWALASRLLPMAEFRQLLVQDLRSPYGHDSRPGKLFSLVMGGQFDMVVGLLQDAELGPAAASALSGLVYGNKQWPLSRLQEVLGEGKLREDDIVDRLLVLAIQHDPESAIEWLTAKLTSAPGQAERWWRRVMPEVPPSEARTRVIRAYFAAAAAAAI